MVLNTPDAPSTILQVPPSPEPSAVDAAALDKPATAAAAAAPTTGEGGSASRLRRSGDRHRRPPAEPAAPEAGDGSLPPADRPTPHRSRLAPTRTLPSAPAMIPEPAPSSEAAGTEAPAPEPEVAAVSPDVAPGETPPTAASEPAAPETAVTDRASGPPEVTPAPALPEPEPEPVITPVVVVTAVEAETSGSLFIAGTAVTREDVRVYVDDVLLGEVTPSPSGTWLLEVERELPAGTYRVRADQIEPGAGTVLARAEVPFEREIEVAILRPVAEIRKHGGRDGHRTDGQPDDADHQAERQPLAHLAAALRKGHPLVDHLPGQQGPDPQSALDLSRPGVHPA